MAGVGSRGARAFAAVAGGVVGVACARWVVPPIVAALGRAAPFGAIAHAVRDRTAVQAEVFPAYLGLLACVAGGAMVALATHARLPRYAWPAIAAASALGTSWQAGAAVLLTLPAVAWLVHRASASEPAARPPVRPRHAALIGGAATLAVAFTLWMTLAEHGAAASAIGLALGLSGGASLVRVRAGAPDDARARDALAATPLLALPLVALARGPSPLWIAVAVALCALARRGLDLAPPPRALVAKIAPLAVPSCVVAMAVMPLRLRELPWVNHFVHEAMHQGWVNSVTHGKWLTTDASTAYGPLREYLLAAWAAGRGVTVEGVRFGFVAANLAALPVLFAAAWRVARGRWALLGAFTLAVVVASPVRFFLDYEHHISLGWVDLLRVTLPLACLVFGVEALAVDRRLARRADFAWGFAAGVSVLYSQELGLCAVAGSLAAGALQAAVGGERAQARARLGEIARRGARYVAGVASPVVLTAAVYGASGRARFIPDLFRWVWLAGAGAGVHDAVPFPVSFEHAVAPLDLFRDGGAQARAILFVLPPALAAIGLFAFALEAQGPRRAGPETPAVRRLALALFALAAYRLTLQRPDPWHLTLGGFGASFVALDLAASVFDAARSSTRSRAAEVALAGVCALVGVRDDDVRYRVHALATRHEAPSTGPRREHAAVPRAGDVVVHPDVVELVGIVQSRTTRAQPIFCRLGGMGGMVGAEWYFLADRRNATRFDTLAEIFRVVDQREILRDLERDPPALVLGEERALVGEDVAAFLDARYAPVARVGTVLVSAPRAASDEPAAHGH